MADFEQAIEKVLLVETGGDMVNGGLTNDPDDPGKLTKWGVSQEAHRDIDVANLTKDGAKYKVYKPGYWDMLHLDDMPDQDVAEELFDTAVNVRGSWKTAATWLQKALNLLDDAQLDPDGFLGPKTMEAVRKYLKAHSYAKTVLLIDLNCQQGAFYRHLAETYPRLRKYYDGWLNKRVRLPRA